MVTRGINYWAINTLPVVLTQSVIPILHLSRNVLPHQSE